VNSTAWEAVVAAKEGAWLQAVESAELSIRLAKEAGQESLGVSASVTREGPFRYSMRALLCEGREALLQSAANETGSTVHDTQVIAACDKAISMYTRARNTSEVIDDPRLAQLHLYRARVHFYYSDFQAAILDLKKALLFERNCPQAEKLQEEVEKAVKAASQKDYYNTLRLKKNATLTDIKKAYRNLGDRYP